MLEGEKLGFGIYLLLYMFFYSVLHSWLASDTAKSWFRQRWPSHYHRYRLLFNLIAVILLLPLLFFWPLFDDALLWQWSFPFNWLMNGLGLAAALCFLHSLKSYDLSLFTGTKQWRDGASRAQQEQFSIGFWHRFVRHPWYFFALVILWTREMDLFQLLLYSAITLYFIIGSRLEERKLLAVYGDGYRRYQQQVPALFPLPWKVLRKAQATQLIEEQNKAGSQ